MPNPIGVSFLPSADNQAMGPQQGALEGGGGDLAQAWKILSMQLPQNLGPQSIAPKRLLTAPGSAGAPGGFNPHAAVFEALLKAMAGGGGGSYMPTPNPMMSQPSGLPSNAYGDFYRGEGRSPSVLGSTPAPQIIPGSEGRGPVLPEPPPSASPFMPTLGSGGGWSRQKSY